MAHSATAKITVLADVGTVLDVALTVEDMIEWFPLPIEPLEFPPSGRLAVGDVCKAGNHLAGRRIETTIEVREADVERYVLVATGPLNFSVTALLTPVSEGCLIEASIEGRSGGGIKGRVLEAASRPLLGPGIRHALHKIAELAEKREQQPSRRSVAAAA